MHMKHILPILTLSTLAAAASAQVAAPAASQIDPLSYNRIGFEISERHSTPTGYNNVNTLSVASMLGSSNFYASASDDQYYTILGLGYVFRNVAFATDVVLLASSGAGYGQARDTRYGITLRRRLPELNKNLEASLGYSNSHGVVGGAGANTVKCELAYNLDAHYQVALGLVQTDEVIVSGQHYYTMAVRYNF